MSVVNPTCPTGCEFDPPVVLFDYCAPTIAFGEIKYLFLRAVESGGLTDWTDSAEWLAAIDNDGEVGGEIRQISIIGSLPEPESTEIPMSLKRKAYPPKMFSIPFKVDEVNDDNHEFMRTMSCNSSFLAWYATDEYMWGGNDGITVQITMHEIIPETTAELYHFVGTMTWENKFPPERTTNPLT